MPRGKKISRVTMMLSYFDRNIKKNDYQPYIIIDLKRKIQSKKIEEK